MRLVLAAGLAAAMLVAVPALAAPPGRAAQDAAVLAPVRQFVAGLNSGHFASAAAAFTGRATILDEFPPFEWHGKAFAKWARDYGAFSKAEKLKTGSLTVSAPSALLVRGKIAYAAIPAHLTLTKAGKPVSEDGQFAFVLKKSTHGWRIQSFAWATK